MPKLNKVFIPLLIAAALLFGEGIALAQSNATDATEAINLDESVRAENLEIEEPTFLPDSPFYFFKEWGRSIQSFFTFNPVKKAELRLRFVNEKIIEAKKIAEKTDQPEIIKKAVKNYQKEMVKNEAAATRIKEKINERLELKESADKFLDKFIQQQILHQRILEKLETQVPTSSLEKIKEAREKHLEMFGKVMTELEEKNKIPERLEKNIEKVKGSQFKNFKNLEILVELEKKAPEEAKEAIQKAQENALKRLKENLEKMSPEDQEKFKNYIENISGNAEEHIKTLENLRSELKPAPEMPRTPESRRLERKLEEIRVKLLPLKGGEISPSQPEELPCAQVITYKIQNDKCYRCPNTCSPIEKCEEVSMEECQKEESLIPRVKESPKR